MEIINEIKKVTDQAELKSIIRAAEEHRRSLEHKQAYALRRGDRCVLNDSISPKYLRGLTGEVVGFMKGTRRVRVKLDMPGFAGRYTKEDGTIDAIIETISPSS